jgi:hypothetical protein
VAFAARLAQRDEEQRAQIALLAARLTQLEAAPIATVAHR